MISKLILVTLVSIFLGEYYVQGQFVNLTQYPGELCSSKCVKGESRLCYFEWTLELYQAMGLACGKCEQGVTSDCLKPQCIIGDGHQKGVMSINRMIPGPPLFLCEGDHVIIDVKNKAEGTAASIHWHGLHMVETPYMDGVPHVTQCPIKFGSTFRYEFYASQAGTYFYHSHAGMHKLNGHYGALIIQKPDDDNPQIDEYDYDLPEHYILVSDWKHDYAENSLPGLPRGESYPDSLLINGRGTYVNKSTLSHNQVPVSIFYVKPGSRYRFNLIDSMSLADIAQVQIEKHSMTVIATDSVDVEPLKVDTLLMNSGERYDIVINANHSGGDFWIRVRGANLMAPNPTDSFALLRYITNDSDYEKPQPPFPDYHDTFPIGVRLNHPQATCFQDDSEYCVVDLNTLKKHTDLVTRKPDYKLHFSYFNNEIPRSERFVPGEYRRFENARGDVMTTGVVNNISLIFPPQAILTQYSEINKNQFCDRSSCPKKCNGETTRECIHMVKVKTNSIVELVLHDEHNIHGMDHPFHLHGYYFAVMGIAKDTSNLTEAIEYASKYRKNRPVLKDTISIPRNGLVVLRFLANNPGVWLMHCHYNVHLATGMAFLFQVGEPDEWVKAPEEFPKCGNYMPEVRDD